MNRTNATRRLVVRLIAGLALGLGTMAGADGQESQPSKSGATGAGIEALRAPELKDPTNAALRHYRAWSMTDKDKLAKFDELWGKESDLKAGWKPSAELATLSGELTEYTDGAMLAAKIPNADWGVEYSDGFMALLPHLGLVRREAKALEARARIALANGKPEEHLLAVGALAACFRLSHHVVNDRTLISSLVGGAMANRVSTVVTSLIDEGVLGKADAAALLSAARSIPQNDPFNMIGALQGELWLAASAFAKTGPDAGKEAAKVARELTSMNDAKDPHKQLVTQIEAMDEAGLRADVMKHRAYFAQAQQVYREGGEQAVARLKDLEQRVQSGEFGITLQLTAPSIMKGYEASAKNQLALRNAIAKLESLK